MRFSAVAVLLLSACSGAPSRLRNVHEIAAGMRVGGGPEGDEAFRELAALGVRTVISVDGALPDAGRARKFGLRYVHIPIGYDGVPEEKAAALAKAIVELEGPFYIHCHHGMHRAPAAAAVGCVMAGRLDAEEAVGVLQTMGTGKQYPGLWAAAREAKRADEAALRARKVELPESAAVAPLAAAMSELDDAFDRRQGDRAREILAAILKTEEFARGPEDFKARMKAAHEAAAAEDFQALSRSCTDCHKAYRNPARK